MRQVVVLHGWSDDSKSFVPLIRFLKSKGYNTIPLFLGDYISLRDEVRIEDVARRMEEVIAERQALPASNRNRLRPTFDMIVHSTGGLVARRWISTYYAQRDCPVRNLVMLAPANFGSALAHKGRSLVARAFKGFRTGFEVGGEMLHALELGSSFQWDLAQNDLFNRDGANGKVYYGADGIRIFVITGTHGYRGSARSLVNENGSDGTVRVAAANLNAHGVTIDFVSDLDNPEISVWSKRGGHDNQFPLAVLADRDHGQVVDPGKKGYSNVDAYRERLGELVLDALATNTAAQYARKVDEWKQVSMDTRSFAGSSAEAVRHRRQVFGRNAPDAEFFHEHYQLVIRAVDQFGLPVPDFFVEFMPKPAGFHRFSSMNKASRYFHREVLEHTHENRRDPSTICLYIDRFDLMKSDGFYSKIREATERQLAMTVTATDPGDHVSYFAHGSPKQRGVYLLHATNQTDRWLKRHSTHFIELVVPRVGTKDLFRLKRA